MFHLSSALRELVIPAKANSRRVDVLVIVLLKSTRILVVFMRTSSLRRRFLTRGLRRIIDAMPLRPVLCREQVGFEKHSWHSYDPTQAPNRGYLSSAQTAGAWPQCKR